MSLIPDDVINQILDRCSIAEVIGGYIPLKRAGKNFKALCPFHNEKSPSFVVNPDKQIFHCFGCGQGGNVISFIMKQERLEFPEAARFLAQKAGIDIPERDPAAARTNSLKQQLIKANELAVEFFHQNLLSGQTSGAKAARAYLQGRKVNLEIVKNFQLGYALDEWDGLINYLRKKDVSLGLMEKAGLIVVKDGKEGYYDRFRNRVMFPIFDAKKQCVAFGARVLQDTGTAKYINSPETPLYTKGEHLYGLNFAKDAVTRLDVVIVVEGYMDFIMPFQAGIENIAASLGTALTVEQIRLLRRYTHNIVMFYDGDAAGEAAMIRSLDLLIEEGMNVKVASLPSGDDPDSFATKFGAGAFNECIGKAQLLFEYKLGRLMARYEHKTIEGRAKIADEMLPTINRFTNEVLKFGYNKRLSEVLGVTEDILLKEMKKIPSAPNRVNAVLNPPPAAGIMIRAVESNILRLMLEDEEFIPMTREAVSPSDFQDARVRQIINTIFDFFDQGKQVSVPNLMNSLNDQQVLQMISGLMATEDILMGDKRKVHRDCLDYIKKGRQKVQRSELLDQIKQAEMAGDNNRLEELKGKFNELTKLK